MCCGTEETEPAIGLADIGPPDNRGIQNDNDAQTRKLQSCEWSPLLVSAYTFNAKILVS